MIEPFDYFFRLRRGQRAREAIAQFYAMILGGERYAPRAFGPRHTAV